MTLFGDFGVLAGGSRLPNVMYAAGQQVRIRANGVIGKVYLKLPLSDVYLVQWPGFPVIEKLYYGSELDPVEVVVSPGTRKSG